VLNIIVPVFDLGKSYGIVRSGNSPLKVLKVIFKNVEEPCARHSYTLRNHVLFSGATSAFNKT